MANIAVIGTGYVGLTTGACFAHLGHDVICADIDAEKIARLEKGEIPIVEKDLERIVVECIAAGKLKFVVGAVNASRTSDFHYLCVPTPQGSDGSADLSYLQAAAAEIAPVLPNGSIVVNKSTVPVGSTQVVARVLERADISVVSNPEFLREGTAIDDFLNPDRVVIGSSDQEAAIKVASLYAKVRAPIMVTDPVSAETIKYASNAFLASKLSFVNSIATLCEKVGADVNDVVLGMGYDSRIGSEFLRPGPGWGGSCFPKDTIALARIAEDAGAVAVMALERVPADIRADGGVARMSDPELILQIMDTVSIPVMAKCRIGHFVEAQILEAIGVDYIDESEVLTPADEAHHINKHTFKVPFVCGCRNLGEALRRIGEGAAMIRTKGEAGTGDVVEAVRHARSVLGEIKRLQNMPEEEVMAYAKEIGAPYDLVLETRSLGRLPVVNFAAGGIASPADAALMMQLGVDGNFVGSGIFKSGDPAKRAAAIVKATTHYKDPYILAEVSRNLGEPMVGRQISNMPEAELIAGRGW